jgi:Sulfotransferase family.
MKGLKILRQTTSSNYDTLFTILQNAAVQNMGDESKRANNLLQSEHGKVMQPAVIHSEPQDDEYDLEDLELELEGRRHRVWEVCVAHGLNTVGEPNAWEFFIDSTHGLVWCNIFKAASSTWLYNFNILGK